MAPKKEWKNRTEKKNYYFSYRKLTFDVEFDKRNNLVWSTFYRRPGVYVYVLFFHFHWNNMY